MTLVKKIAVFAHVDIRPRKPHHCPGYVINFKVEFLCTGTTKELENWYEDYFLPSLKDLFLTNFEILFDNHFDNLLKIHSFPP